MWGIILVWTLKFEPCPNDGQNHFPKSIIFFLTFGSETFREFLRMPIFTSKQSCKYQTHVMFINLSLRIF